MYTHIPRPSFPVATLRVTLSDGVCVVNMPAAPLLVDILMGGWQQFIPYDELGVLPTLISLFPRHTGSTRTPGGVAGDDRPTGHGGDKPPHRGEFVVFLASFTTFIGKSGGEHRLAC